MKRYILISGLALGAAVMGCRDKASTFDNDTPAATGSRNVDTYDRNDVKSDGRELKNDADRTGNKISTELKQWKNDIDEEFKDKNEPGDKFGSETDAVAGGKKGSKDTVEGDTKNGAHKAKQDADEEFKDSNERSDKAGGETDTVKGGKR